MESAAPSSYFLQFLASSRFLNSEFFPATVVYIAERKSRKVTLCALLAMRQTSADDLVKMNTLLTLCSILLFLFAQVVNGLTLVVSKDDLDFEADSTRFIEVHTHTYTHTRAHARTHTHMQFAVQELYSHVDHHYC